MTLNDAIKSQRDYYDILSNNSKPISCQWTDNLDDVNNIKIEVRLVSAGVINSIAQQSCDGTTMKYDGRYVVFLSDSPSAPPSGRLKDLKGNWLNRYYLLHEYAHIKNGDVFEDDPLGNYDLKIRSIQGDPVATDILHKRELEADKYALYQIKDEVEKEGKHQLVKAIEAEINLRKF